MMKNPRLLAVAGLACALVVSCEKPASEAERNAQVEREVQQRVAAERQADEQQRLTTQAADLQARAAALAAREDEAAQQQEEVVAAATPRASPRPTATRDRDSDSDSVASLEQESPRSYDTFYRKLEPYGSWRETSDYGFVWQPQQAQQADWRPYTDGRWAYTDAGWTWISDEPFGWATCHYGRWTRLRGVGWVWVPGDEWAPAWVSWRSSDQHVGWAPLPPEARFERRTGIHKWADSYYNIEAGEYVFIPTEEIGAANVRRVVLPPQQNITIVNQTTNVTNITYNNTTIINGGPDFDRLRAHSRQPIERLRIQRQYELRDGQAEQPTVQGNVVVMIAPRFTAQVSERPRKVGAPIRDAAVDRTWASVGNQAEAERARAKMRAEATPPPDAPTKKYVKPVQVASTPEPVATPAPIAAPLTTPTPTAIATASPRLRRFPSPVATPQPTASPVATIVATASPTPTATATVRSRRPLPAATPVPSATPLPVTTPEPASTATVRPAFTPRPRSTPLATPVPVPVAESPVERSTPVAAATPLTTPTPIRAATPDETPRNAPPVGGDDVSSRPNRRSKDGRNPQRRGPLPPEAAPPELDATATPAEIVPPDASRPPRSTFSPRVAPRTSGAADENAGQPLPEATVAAPRRRQLPITSVPAVPPPAAVPVQPAPPAAAIKPASRLSDLDAPNLSSPTPTATPTAAPAVGAKRPGAKAGRRGRPGKDDEPTDQATATPAGSEQP